MSSKPFVVRYDIQSAPFAAQFLAADDFDLVSLRNICKDLDLNRAGAKNALIGYVRRYLEFDHTFSGAQPILHNLIRRPKKWFTLKQGNLTNCPKLNNPDEIVYSEGKEEWYGPIILPEDYSVSWYIRPSFIPHWEIDVATN